MSVFLPSLPIAIYARVSTQSQVGGRFDSCESQVAICREYIARHASTGWFEVAAFVDAAYSGGDMNRPGLQALLVAIESGVIKAVLVYKFERLVRCMEGWSSFRAFLNKHGCKLISASEDLCDRLPSGRLRNNLLVAVAEYERLNTAEKVRTKMMEQVKRGIWNCGQVPFGYDYDRQTKMLFPNAEEAPVVTSIYEQAARLIPASEIERKLATDGTKTRMRIFRQRDGNVRAVGARSFRTDALRRLIASPIYAGRLRFKGQEFRGNHLPIVELDLWERANEGPRGSAGSRAADPIRQKLGDDIAVHWPEYARVFSEDGGGFWDQGCVIRLRPDGSGPEQKYPDRSHPHQVWRNSGARRV